MSDESKDNLDSVVDELRTGLEDGSITLDRENEDKKPRDFAKMREEAKLHLERFLPSAISVIAATSAVPGSSSMLLRNIHTSLVYNIARVYGFTPSMEESGKIATQLFGSTIGRTAALEASTFVPVIGWLFKPVLAAGLTKAFGNAAIDHFEEKAQERLHNVNRTPE